MDHYYFKVQLVSSQTSRQAKAQVLQRKQLATACQMQ